MSIPALCCAAGGCNGAVDVEVRDRAEQIAAPARPQLRAHRVDRLHQRRHVGLGEPAAEIAGRGRVRDQIRAQGVHVGAVVAQPFDVFEPGPAAGHVVGQVQHVVGFVIGQVHLQQLQILVDPIDQPQFGDQPMHRSNTAESGGVDVGADLVAHRARVQHRPRLRTPAPRPRVPRRHPAPPACDVPPTLFMRYLLHHKGLPRWAALSSQTQSG